VSTARHGVGRGTYCRGLVACALLELHDVAMLQRMMVRSRGNWRRISVSWNEGFIRLASVMALHHDAKT
jgi:hypothetical protein